MIGCVGYSHACEELFPNSSINFYYEELATQFPLCHFIFATIVSSSYYTIPTDKQNINENEITSQAELHRKNRMILYVFCGLLHVNSRELLKHWAQCEPLGYFLRASTSLVGTRSLVDSHQH